MYDRDERSAPVGEDVEARGLPGGPAGVDQDALQLAEHRLRRALADLENYRKRFDRELHRLRLQERETILKDLLPVADNFERALAAPESDAWRAGVRAVQRQLLDVLRKHGVEPVEDTGRAFDPEWHDVVATVPADADDGTVVQVAERGYRMGDRPLRHARVVVARGGGDGTSW